MTAKLIMLANSIRTARQQQGWSQQQLADFAEVSLSPIERAERGEPIRVENLCGDAQSRLLLHQPKEADKALIAMQKETNDPEIEPITKVDLLYYQAEAQIQQGEIEPSVTILTEAATLAKSLGSRLYFNKLAASYHQLEEQWPKERVVTALAEVFQP